MIHPNGIQKIGLSLTLLLTFLGISCLQAQVSIPYQEDFETLVTGDLDGQNGWVSDKGVVILSNENLAHSGVNYVRIPPNADFRLAQLTLDGSTIAKPVYLDFFVKPVAVLDDENTALEFLDAQGALIKFIKIDREGQISVLNGDGQGSGDWLPIGKPYNLTTNHQSLNWIRITLKLDFQHQIYDVWLDEQLEAVNLGFIQDTPYFADLSIMGSTSAEILVDGIQVVEYNPLDTLIHSEEEILSLANLQLWLTARKGTVLHSNSVSFWKDQSNQGFAAYQLDPVKQPQKVQYDNLDYLEFSDTDNTELVIDHAENLNFTNGTLFTVQRHPQRELNPKWSVLKGNVWNHAGYGISNSSTSDPVASGFYIHGSQTAPETKSSVFTAKVAREVPTISTFVLDQEELEVRAYSNGFNERIKTLDQKTDFSNLQNLSIGAGGQFTGSIAEYLYFNRVLSSAEIQTVENFLAHYYSIPLDRDQDGWDDLWESNTFGSVDQDPSTDYDQDGLTNGYELANSLDPTQKEFEFNGTGYTFNRIFQEIAGKEIGDLTTSNKFPLLPDEVLKITELKTPTKYGDNYGSQITAFLYPQVTGTYTFNIRGDNRAELWLSSNEKAENRQKIAEVANPTYNWAKYPSQTSPSIQLEAGQKYYLEVLHKEEKGNDFLEVAWTIPGDVQKTLSGAFLSPVGLENDTDMDSLPDPWEQEHFNSLKFSFKDDNDNDGLSNLVEFNNQLDPLSADLGIAQGALLREVWTQLSGNQLSSLTSSKNYPLNPNYKILVNSTQRDQNWSQSFGEKISGTLEPKISGNYYFQVAGDDQVELWLSSTKSPAQKKRIAYTESLTRVDQWNKFPEQKSTAIYLQQGESYYLEILHKQNGSLESLQVEWKMPGGFFEPINKHFISPVSKQVGFALLEVWEQIPYSGLNHLVQNENFPNNPDSTQYIPGFQIPHQHKDRYGSRLRAYIKPTQTGPYTFHVCGDNQVELFLSSDQSPENSQKIVGLYKSTGIQQWDKYPEQNSPSIQLQAGESYYLELLHKENYGGDYATVAWTTPSGTFRLLPQDQLAPYQAFADSDTDGMSNLYENQYGLNKDEPIDAFSDWDQDNLLAIDEALLGTQANQEDSDGDTVKDSIEVFSGSDPLNPEDSPQSTQTWNHYTIGKAELASYEYKEQLIVETNGRGFKRGKDLGAGIVGREVTGDFTFSTKIANTSATTQDAQAGIVLRSSTDLSSDFVSIRWGENYGLRFQYRNGDHYNNQWGFSWFKGNPIWLKIEKKGIRIIAYHSRDGVNWIPSGELLYPFPDQVIVGLYAYNSSEVEHSLFAFEETYLSVDSDGDGLSDTEEQTLGTNALSVDSDNDGINDYVEARILFTNPNKDQFKDNTQHVLTASGSSTISATGNWQKEGDSVYARSVRGELDYELEIPEQGWYLIQIHIHENNPYGGIRPFTIDGILNGDRLGRQIVEASYNQAGIATYITPLLDAGEHDFTIDWINGTVGTFLQVESIELSKLSGQDQDENGHADWLENRSTGLTTMDESPVNTYISPYTLEGESKAFNELVVQSSFVGDETVEVVVEKGTDNGFYVQLPLDPSAITNIELTDASSALSLEKPITWDSYDLLADLEPLSIPFASSMLMQADNSSFVITAPDGIKESFELLASELLEYKFDQEGSYTIKAIQAQEGEPTLQTFNHTITTVKAVFGSSPTVVTGNSRNWKPQSLPEPVAIESDQRLLLIEKSVSGSAREYEISLQQSIPAIVVARLGEKGPILDKVEVNAIKNYAYANSKANIVERFSDGTELWKMVLSLEGEIHDDISIVLNIFKAGVMFEDGSIYKKITKDDFNEDGTYEYYMYRPSGTKGSVCHKTTVYQNGEKIASGY